MSITDTIAVFGEALPGTVNEEEFKEMLTYDFLPSGVLNVIDAVTLSEP
jgi:hypothetical protein